MDGRWGQDWLSDGLEAGRAGGPGGWGTLAGPGVPRAKQGWRSQEVRGWRSYAVRAGGLRGAGRGGAGGAPRWQRGIGIAAKCPPPAGL